MILSYHSRCKCSHPLDWHMWFPREAGDWPLRNCTVYSCKCEEFTITFFTWLAYTLVRRWPDFKKLPRVGLKYFTRRHY